MNFENQTFEEFNNNQNNTPLAQVQVEPMPPVSPTPPVQTSSMPPNNPPAPPVQIQSALPPDNSMHIPEEPQQQTVYDDIVKAKQVVDKVQQVYFMAGRDGDWEESVRNGTGEAVTQATFRYEENDVYTTYRRIDNAAAWLSVFAEDYQKLDAASQYSQVFNTDNLPELQRLGLYSEQHQNEFQHIAGMVPYSSDDLQHIADYGSINLTISFTDSEKQLLRDFTSNHTATFKDARDMLAAKGFNPNELSNEVTVRFMILGWDKKDEKNEQPNKLDNPFQYIRTFDDSGRVVALEALAERNSNASLFNVSNDSERGQMVQLYRELRYKELGKSIGLTKFTGSEKDYLEIMETHHEIIDKKKEEVKALQQAAQTSDSKIAFAANKKDRLLPEKGPQVEEFHMFRGKRLTNEQYKILMDGRAAIGENNRSMSFLSKKNAKIKSMPTMLMDDTMKTGFRTVSTVVDYTRRLTSFAYSANLKRQINHVEFLKKNYSAEGDLLQRNLKDLLKNDTLFKRRKLKEGALQDAEKIGEKAKDYLSARENLRNARRGSTRDHIKAAKEQVRVEKRAYRGARRELKESKLSDVKRQRLQARRRARNARRERFNNSHIMQYKRNIIGRIKARFERQRKKFFDFRHKIMESKYGKAVSHFVEGGQAIIGKIIAFFAGAAVLIIKWLFTICLWGCVIGIIVSFIVGLFDDKTNYAEVAQIDMYDLEDSFNYMVKKQVYDEFQEKLDLKKDELLSLKYSTPNKAEYQDNTGDHYVTIAEPAIVGYLRGVPYMLSSGQKDYRWEPSTNPGSIVPYFAIAKYRYNEELDKDWYRTYLAYMTYLWVNSHYYQKNESTQIRNITHIGNLDAEGCDNPVYHKKISEYYDVPLSTLMYYFDRGLYARPAINYTYYTDNTKKNTATERCDKCSYTYEVDRNNLICGHIHEPWVSAEQPGCYETITAQSYQLICTKEPHTHGVDICDLQCIHLGEEGHVCDENCEKVCVIEEHTHIYGNPDHPSDTSCYGYMPEDLQGALKCGHVHSSDVAALCNIGLTITDSCYGSHVTCTCTGHCGGHIEPQVTLYYVDDIESIVKSANCTTDLFKPTRRIPYYMSHQPKMFMDDIIDRSKYTLKEIWNKLTKREKEEDKTIYDEWKEHWKGVFSDINDSNNPMWPKFESDGEKLSEAEAMHEYGNGRFSNKEIEEMRSLYGDSDAVGGDNYMSGIELWEDFDVYFPKPLSGNTSELIKEYTEKIKTKYGLSGTQNLVITLNALLEVGKWTCLNNDASYNVENHTAGSTGIILYILGKSGYNVSNIHSTDDLTNWLGLSSKKAKQNGRVVELNKKIGLDILASTYKSMKPGTIVFQDRSGLDKRQYDQDHIAIFLGAYKNDKDDNDYIYTFAEASAATGQFTIVQYGVSALDKYFNKAWYIEED